ncbi:uncharacterized protein N7482_005302 [Penicillium canariense]|uniref:Uncharacterized protein n=1 Tax=Penicillium canariense TaxID=189055 RepID=A0A9W9I293_9EURO|nr:uncharacterized protein N7482_005302 [Penicillium canariense]KAJ5166521.1 hypothetical protein N7482_005302 [Penicillium canariense]
MERHGLAVGNLLRVDRPTCGEGEQMETGDWRLETGDWRLEKKDSLERAAETTGRPAQHDNILAVLLAETEVMMESIWKPKGGRLGKTGQDGADEEARMRPQTESHSAACNSPHAGTPYCMYRTVILPRLQTVPGVTSVCCWFLGIPHRHADVTSAENNGCYIIAPPMLYLPYFP